MKSVVLDLPSFGFIASARAALGVGVGLLMADRLPAAERRIVGGLLVTVGAFATIPAAMALKRGLRDRARSKESNAAGRSTAAYEEHLVGAVRWPRKGNEDILSTAVLSISQEDDAYRNKEDRGDRARGAGSDVLSRLDC